MWYLSKITLQCGRAVYFWLRELHAAASIRKKQQDQFVAASVKLGSRWWGQYWRRRVVVGRCVTHNQRRLRSCLMNQSTKFCRRRLVSFKCHYFLFSLCLWMVYIFPVTVLHFSMWMVSISFCLHLSQCFICVDWYLTLTRWLPAFTNIFSLCLTLVVNKLNVCVMSCLFSYSLSLNVIIYPPFPLYFTLLCSFSLLNYLSILSIPLFLH